MIDVPAQARPQGGVFTTAQALDAGWTPRRIRRRIETGQWVRLPGGALVAADIPRTPALLARGVRLSWPEAVACDRTAGAIWRLPVAQDDVVHVLAGPGRHATGVRVHRAALTDRETYFVDAWLAVTTQQRTHADLLASLAEDQALDCYAWLVTRRLIDRAGLHALIRQRAGRQGVGALRRLAERTRTGALSEAERRFHALLLAAGIDGWEANVAIGVPGGPPAWVDVLFRDAGLAIEIDGRRSHDRDVASFVAERRRANQMVLADLRVLRFTWWDIVERPDDVVRQVRAMLEILTRSPIRPR